MFANMGQCQFCRRKSAQNTNEVENKEDPGNVVGLQQEGEALAARHSGSDSAVDSGHNSCCEEASCAGEQQGRDSHSSESSGKYSLRESVGSAADCDKASMLQDGANGPSLTEMQELPVFSETESGSEKGGSDEGCDQDALRPLQDIRRARKVSRASTDSDRGSLSSITSVTGMLRARLSRSASLKTRQRHNDEAGTPCLGSPPLATSQAPRRAVSLRLPRSHDRQHDSDTNLPTIYVEDSPVSRSPHPVGRKSSLRRALSLLSVNSLVRNYPPAPRPQKPVVKILRQPRRRHNTVRGMSGMAIDTTNRVGLDTTSRNGLQRANTFYYPTAATMRHNYASRRTYSDNHS